MADFQPVVFRLGEERYGIDISYVNAIERTQTIVRVPNSARSIKGIINLRGDIIPVVDLRTKFRMTDSDFPEDSEFIIIDMDKNKIAIEVDGVEGIHNADDESIHDMPIIAKGTGVEYFDSVIRVNDKLVIIINPMELLSEKELKAVERLAEENRKTPNR